MSRPGAWTKGQSGNPSGRKPGIDSLAEQIRKSATKKRRRELFDKMWSLAIETHDDPRVRVMAAEWLAKHGWPQEAKGVTTVITDGGKTVVRHEHIQS